MNFRATEYLFTPKDVYAAVRNVGRRRRGQDWLRIAILINVGIFLRMIFNLELDAIFFWLFAAALFWWKLDARISIGAALLSLITIPILFILFDKGIFYTGEIWAEKVAVWAYYFLVIGVVKQIYDYKKENKEEDRKEKIKQTPLDLRKKKRSK